MPEIFLGCFANNAVGPGRRMIALQGRLFLHRINPTLCRVEFRGLLPVPWLRSVEDHLALQAL